MNLIDNRSQKKNYPSVEEVQETIRFQVGKYRKIDVPWDDVKIKFTDEDGKCPEVTVSVKIGGGEKSDGSARLKQDSYRTTIAHSIRKVLGWLDEAPGHPFRFAN